MEEKMDLSAEIVEVKTAAVPMEEALARFSDYATFSACCRECPAYGATWGCPPYDYDPVERLRGYKTLTVVGARIRPCQAGLPIESARELLRGPRRRLQAELLEQERSGEAKFAFSFAGSCIYCPEGECTRRSGEPCRHPESVRPSLEAWGFNIGAICTELLGMELKWSTDGKVPEYLTLVSGYLD